MQPINARIIDIKDETPSIRTLFFDVTLENALPGQFVMVWIRGVDEIPMALSYTNAITVQKVGDATSQLFELEIGDSVGIRGPFGNGFSIPKKRDGILIIAGGVGAAPLAPLAEFAVKKGAEVTTILGARTCSELLFKKRFSAEGDIHITTDDGSAHRCGFVTDVLEELNTGCFDMIYTCGPEIMMSCIFDLLESKGCLENAEFSMHRYFKCAIGVCGACCMDDQGWRVCRDGPVFGGMQLTGSELGKYKRDSCGRIVKL